MYSFEKKILVIFSLTANIVFAQKTDRKEYNLTYADYEISGTGKKVDRLAGVTIDKTSDHLLFYGNIEITENGAATSYPWLGEYQYSSTGFKKGLSHYDNFFNYTLLKDNKTSGRSFDHLVLFANGNYGIMGSASTIHNAHSKIHPAIKNIQTISDSRIYGFHRTKSNTYVAGYYFNNNKKFGLYLMDENFTEKKVAPNSSQNWSFNGQENVYFHMCPEADSKGFHYIISTRDSDSPTQTYFYLNQAKIEPNGFTKTPIVKATKISPKLYRKKGPNSNDSVKTFAHEMLLLPIHPWNSAMLINKKGNICMVAGTSSKTGNNSYYAAYIECTPDGKLVRFDSLGKWTFADRHKKNRCDMKVSTFEKYPGEYYFSLVMEKGGGAELEDCEFDLIIVNPETGEVTNNYKYKINANKIVDKSSLCRKEIPTTDLGGFVHSVSTFSSYIIMLIHGCEENAGATRLMIVPVKL